MNLRAVLPVPHCPDMAGPWRPNAGLLPLHEHIRMRYLTLNAPDPRFAVLASFEFSSDCCSPFLAQCHFVGLPSKIDDPRWLRSLHT